MTSRTEGRTMHSHTEHSRTPHQARSVAAHRTAVTELLGPLLAQSGTEQLALRDALGKGLAQDVFAPLSLPPFANSQMDGFAVNSLDVSDGGAELPVVVPVPAGAVPAALDRGTAAPIMTGAMIPAGADAVVPVERAVPDRFPPRGNSLCVAAGDGGRHLRAVGRE
ncbi:putative molybdopterin biosynthesis protein MJ0886 [Arthrobacter sp. Hiyo4]|nr:putative molybdopterin biosynthesis protein MJ0886 [Arthrobacter sp. Hiyo4]